MFPKLLTVIIVLTATGAVLLGLREQRLDVMHRMATLHGQMNHTRKQMWNLQTSIAQQTDPTTLREKLQQAGLNMVPIPTGGTDKQSLSVFVRRAVERRSSLRTDKRSLSVAPASGHESQLAQVARGGGAVNP